MHWSQNQNLNLNHHLHVEKEQLDQGLDQDQGQGQGLDLDHLKGGGDVLHQGQMIEKEDIDHIEVPVLALVLRPDIRPDHPEIETDIPNLDEDEGIVRGLLRPIILNEMSILDHLQEVTEINLPLSSQDHLPEVRSLIIFLLHPHHQAQQGKHDRKKFIFLHVLFII